VTIIPSPQQIAVKDFIRTGTGSANIEAAAGAAKTTTLLQILPEIPATRSVAFVAFGKEIAQEIKAKVEPMKLKNVTVGTAHSYGFGSYRRNVSRVTVKGNKLVKIAREEFTGEYEHLQEFVVSAASMAKQYGIGIAEEDTDSVWEKMFDHHDMLLNLPDNVSIAQAVDASRYLLNISNNMRNVIDFSDMIYLPLLHNMKMWQYDYILLDEAQDTNRTRRILIKRMLLPGGRLIAVGDSRQAIFGFTGADADSMDKIAEDFNSITLPLSVSFRCPKAGVRLAQQYVGEEHIQYHDNAIEGEIKSCAIDNVSNLVKPEDVIICRNMRPLVTLAYQLLRKGVGCRVEGRAIGEGLINTALRWKSSRTVQILQDKLEAWGEKEIAKHKDKGNNSMCQKIEDQVETLLVFIMQCDPDDKVETLVNNIRSMFDDTEKGDNQHVVVLSTIHKSKGREWKNVFGLGMNIYSPSKWATKAWQMEQENNLLYVLLTRFKETLTLIEIPAKSK
jgi:DNA helicase-2/ATP-dependent DNA helicase PcrA